MWTAPPLAGSPCASRTKYKDVRPGVHQRRGGKRPFAGGKRAAPLTLSRGLAPADPTIKYFTAETGDGGRDYEGGRSFDDLNKFVVDNLAAKCLVDDTSACSEKEVRCSAANLHRHRLPRRFHEPRPSRAGGHVSHVPASRSWRLPWAPPASRAQLGYLNKMKAATKEEVAKQLARLMGMQNDSMAPDLKAWVKQRIAILEQLK